MPFLVGTAANKARLCPPDGNGILTIMYLEY